MNNENRQAMVSGGATRGLGVLAILVAGSMLGLLGTTWAAMPTLMRDGAEARVRAQQAAMASRSSDPHIVTDADGAILVTGVFRGTVDFDPGEGVDARTAKGGDDVFVTKYGADGSYEWTRTWGGDGNDEPIRIDIDSQGRVKVDMRS